MSEAPTYALRTTLQVDEQQIITALLAEVQKRLYGPEFSSGDLVRFTDAIVPANVDPDDDPFGDHWFPDELKAVMRPGALAIVASHTDERGERPYQLFVFDAKGEARPVNVSADQIKAYRR